MFSDRSVVAESVRPIYDDVMAISLIADGSIGLVVLLPGSATTTITLLKLKEDLGGSERREVFVMIKAIKDRFRSIDLISFGENFGFNGY
ncbi:hypothetical protein Acr_00g0085370 [Actinidia rufa]|uniref:Uncharacterized protein n=1 Tax=Actinidia rufa TaxID=165716 RepID=A0A7J0DW49_9ERIC|nr:hypothetical protein Acr_00g0085370 [Actinidia rufa]